MASRRSLPLRLAAALTAVLALGACTAGVPRTGKVVTISPAASTTPAVDPGTVEGGGGPPSGLSESEVAVGFLRAMNTGRTSVIRNWVVPGARDTVDGWSPRTTIRVYSVLEPGLPFVRGDKRIVPIRVKLSGQLEDGRDWYPASGDQTINLEMGRDGADPRVADPGEVMWMRDVNFERLYTQVEIFMVPDRTALPRRLSPVPVFVRRGNQSDPGAMAKRVEDALELLLAGPRGRYDNLDTAIPARTRLRDFGYADELATVDLSRELLRTAGPGELPVGQIVWTVTSMLRNAQVRILVEGRQLGAIGADRFQAGRLWRRTDEQLVGLWPQRSSDRDSDSVLFVRGGEIYMTVPGIAQSPKVVGLNAAGPVSGPTWSPNHRWMAFLVGGGTSQAMWLWQPGGRAIPATNAIQGMLSPPSWSPDSQRVYLVSRFQGRSRLWEVRRSSFTARELGFPELPSGLQPASVAVSPDGAFVLAVADRPRPGGQDIDPAPSGRLFVGQLGPDGVIAWSQRQLASGLGRVFSPVWVDPLTVAFIAETDIKDDLGKLWVVKSDGWDPTALVNNGTDGGLVADVGRQLTVNPNGDEFIVTVRSSSGASLWTVDREGRTMRPLTVPVPNAFDTDPSYASR